jgi:putative ABC transport system permease protein
MTSMAHHLYRLLLLILPRGFRHEFGREMLQAFDDRRAPLIVEAADVIQLAVRLRVDQVRMDVRHAARSLWHQKTFTLTAIATLALALGPATAVFSLFNGVLLDPVPLARDLDRVIAATTANPERNRLGFPWSELNFLDHRDRKVGLAHLGAFIDTSATIGGEVPRQVLGAWVSEDMFDVLRVYPTRGRKFEAADMRPGAAPTIILNHEFAASRFPGGDAVGQSMMVDGRATTVIGVLPRGFEFPAGDGQFWQPLIVDRATSNRAQTYLRVMGRLADGATLEDVNRQMNAVADDLARQYPASNAGYRIDVAPAAAQLTRGVRRIVTVLGVAAIAILLLACTNVASLLVVRTAGRRDELSVRTALGASASRLSRQLLIEHLLLALAAALVAVLVAGGLLQLLALSNLVPAAQVARATIDGATSLFLLGLTIFIAVALGWIVSRRATTAAAITVSQRSQSATRELVRLRQALVSVEVGAAVVLLLAAGLLLQSAARLLAIDPGFRTDNVITFQITLPATGYLDPAVRVRFAEGLVAELKRLPGVQAAASAAYPPMGSTRATRRFAIDGEPLPQPGTEPLAIDLPASPDYASLMGLRVIQGRWIDERDRADAPPVVVISESFAKQHLPGQQAIGKRLRYFTSRPGQQAPMAEIVGVVSDVRQFGMAEAEAPQMYIPHAQRSWAFASYFVRTTADPRSVMASLPTAVRAVDRERPIERLRTVDALVQSNTEDRRALSLLIALAAAIALLISAIGVYGVTAATTAARRRELAIRAAVGADPRRLMTLVIRQGMVAAVAGVTVGIASGVAASSLLEAVLFEVKARDPWTFATVGLGLLAVCALATYLPARRAVSGSPAVTLNEPA